MRWYGWVAIAAVGVIVWIMWGFFANLIELKPDGPEAEAALAAAVGGRLLLVTLPRLSAR